MAIIDKPSDYFETVTYAGGTTDISSLDFQPDFVWGKKRTGAENHALFDSVRGATKTLNSNTNAAESTRSGSLTSFDSDGFTMGGSDGIISSSGNNYVAWSWKAGTSFTNDASSTGVGSIDSAGSVSTTAGFSIITYTGNGTGGASIAHGLGAVPNLVLIKCTNEAHDWAVYYGDPTDELVLNATAATLDTAVVWNDTAPTSSILTLGSRGGVNANTQTHVAYCFTNIKGYSKSGSYIGNGNADGTFVYTGFKPKFVLIKQAIGNNATNWSITDDKRLGYNPDNRILYTNSNATEDSYDPIEHLSNGFKLISPTAGYNDGGDTYIYLAFGQSIVGTNNVPNNAR